MKRWIMKRMRFAFVAVIFLLIYTMLAPPVVVAEDSDVVDSADAEVKALSGMSVLGNNEAPKSLVIVPWKSSELGDGLGIDNLLDERARPVDKEVFKRELSYYRLRTTKTEQ